MTYRRHKYHAREVYYEGHRFQSTGEGSRYLFLRGEERAGRISGLRLQVPFVLAEAIYAGGTGKNGKPIRGKTVLSGVTYMADFVYVLPDGRQVVEDYKGYETPEFKMKERWLYEKYGIRLVKPKRPAQPVDTPPEM